MNHNDFRSLWSVIGQSEPESPLIVEIPHAGLAIPSDVADGLIIDASQTWKDADLFVDELYAGAASLGASMIVSHVSRYVIDLNRSEDDIDVAVVPTHPNPKANQPRGVVWQTDTDGNALQRGPLSLEAFEYRLEHFHRPYHRALAHLLSRAVQHFGRAVVIAAHSMPSQGRAKHTDSGRMRADVVPGTLGRTSSDAEWIDLVDQHFRDANFSVKHDDPYKGGFTTAHYGQPQHDIHVVQLELNRALYMNERTGERSEPGFTQLRKAVDALIEKLVARTQESIAFK